MYRLNHEFTLINGPSLILRGDPGWTCEQADDLARQMLSHAVCPGILGPEWDERDGEIRLRYAFSGKRLLLKELQPASLRLPDYFEMMEQAVRALVHCSEQMLNSDCLSLHPEFVFCEPKTVGSPWKLHFVYLPLRRIKGKPPAFKEFEALSCRLIPALSEIPGTALQEWLEIVLSGRYPYVELLAKLGPLKESVLEAESTNKADSSFEANYSADLPEPDGQEESLEDSFWLKAKNVLWRGWPSAKPKPKTVFDGFSEDFLLADDHLQAPAAVPLKTSPAPTRSVGWVEPDRTVQLSVDEFLGMSGHAVLEADKPGGSHPIPVTSSPLVIGRDPHRSDFVVDLEAVSKTHCEIYKQNDGYFIKDLASANGTELNGTRLAPYDETPISNGDIIRIPGEKFTFLVT